MLLLLEISPGFLELPTVDIDQIFKPQIAGLDGYQELFQDGFDPIFDNGRYQYCFWSRSGAPASCSRFSRYTSLQAPPRLSANSRAAKSNSNNTLISDIAQYILKFGGSSVTNGAQDAQANAKKRKLDDSSTSAPSGTAPKGTVEAQFELKDVSVSIPQRKKLHLELSDERVQLRNPASGQVELSEDIKKYGEHLPCPLACKFLADPFLPPRRVLSSGIC